MISSSAAAAATAASRKHGESAGSPVSVARAAVPSSMTFAIRAVHTAFTSGLGPGLVSGAGVALAGVLIALIGLPRRAS